jgi:hypothetical protein
MEGGKESGIILDPEDLGFQPAIQTDDVCQKKGRRESSEALLPSGRRESSEALLPNKVSEERTPLPSIGNGSQTGRSEALLPSEVSKEHLNSTPLPSVKVCGRHLPCRLIFNCNPPSKRVGLSRYPIPCDHLPLAT